MRKFLPTSLMLQVAKKWGMTILINLSMLLSYSAFNQAWSNSQMAPQRIISLAPHITEMLFSAGAGDKVVGVVAYSDFPKAALDIDSIGSYQAINIEKIILLNPDLIIAWKSGNRLKDIEKLEQLGFKVVYSEPYKLTDIPKEVRAFGEQLGTQVTANAVADALENKLQSLIQTYQTKPKVSAYYQIWNAPLMTINGEQSISQAMSICGAENIFADLPLLAAEVSIESVIQQNPDAILLGGQKQMQQGWLKAWQKWQTISAVKNQQIYLLKADNFQRPTARLIESIEGLCQKIDQVRVLKSAQ
jgi:iron complex transport system substrate-binding protein